MPCMDQNHGKTFLPQLAAFHLQNNLWYKQIKKIKY